MGRDPLRRGLCSGGGGDYQPPSFSAFGIDSQTTPIEVGDLSLANPVFSWATNYSANVQPGTLDIDDITGATNIATGLPNTSPYAATYAAIQKLAATNHKFRLSGLNTHLEAFSRDYDIYWQWRRYYGESATEPLNEAQIKALRVGELASGFAGIYTLLGGNYKSICYAAALGTATSFIDQSTGFPVAMLPVYTVNVTNSFGVTTSYNVHRTWNPLGGGLNIIVG